MTIQIGDNGTVLVYTFKLPDGSVRDISTATVKLVHFVLPNAQLITKTAVFVTDGVDGQVKITSDAALFAVDGKWESQAFVDMPSWAGYSEPITFEVNRNIHPTLR